MVNAWHIWLFKSSSVVELPGGVEGLVRKFGDKYEYIVCCPRKVCRSVAAALFPGVEDLDHNPGPYRWRTVKYLMLNGPCADAGFSLQLSEEGQTFTPPLAKRGRFTH